MAFQLPTPKSKAIQELDFLLCFILLLLTVLGPSQYSLLNFLLVLFPLKQWVFLALVLQLPILWVAQ